MTDINQAHEITIAALQGMNTHETAEVLFRVAAQLWLVIATRDNSVEADRFIEALAADLQDAAKHDGRKFLERSMN